MYDSEREQKSPSPEDGSRPRDSLGSTQAQLLKLLEQGVQTAHVLDPGPQAGGLLVGEHSGDGLAAFLAGPDVVGAVSSGGVGGAGAAWVSASGAVRSDGAAQHQADLCHLLEEGAMALLQLLDREVQGTGVGRA